jgi:2,4-diacetylphloroglucinol hydrolase
VTPVTYIPVQMQKQCVSAAERIRGKPYEAFFDTELLVPADRLDLIQRGPMPEAFHVRPNPVDVERSIREIDAFPDAGWALVDGSVAFVQSRMFMPGVTVEIMRWWFLWHANEPERYSLWFPHAHVSNTVSDRDRYQDEALSYGERLYNNTNTVLEYIGPSLVGIDIHFQSPEELGLNPAFIEAGGFAFNASAWNAPSFAPDTAFSLMIHLGRDTEQGFEFISRYWIGAHADLNRYPGGEHAPAVLETMGFGPDELEGLAYELSVHDMTEFHHLAGFLPDLYRKFS